MMPASRNPTRHAGYSPEHQGIHDLQGIHPDQEVQGVRGYLGDQVDPETLMFMLYMRIAGHIKHIKTCQVLICSIQRKMLVPHMHNKQTEIKSTGIEDSQCMSAQCKSAQ